MLDNGRLKRAALSRPRQDREGVPKGKGFGNVRETWFGYQKDSSSLAKAKRNRTLWRIKVQNEGMIAEGNYMNFTGGRENFEVTSSWS